VRPRAAPAAGTGRPLTPDDGGANYQKKIISWAPATVARNPRIAVRDKTGCAHPQYNGETSQNRNRAAAVRVFLCPVGGYRQVKIGLRRLTLSVRCGHNENTNGAAGA
jgi:hypothetical protein